MKEQNQANEQRGNEITQNSKKLLSFFDATQKLAIYSRKSSQITYGQLQKRKGGENCFQPTKFS